MIRNLLAAGAVLACAAVLAACSPRNVSFNADVQPVLKQHCLECHVPGGTGYNASGFNMSTYESLMKGGKFGTFVIPGDPISSTLNMLAEGRADASIHMPRGREKLSDREVEILKVWVQEGAKNN